MTITMYGADWCGDCRRAKAYFDDHDVEFEYVRLDETPDAVEVVLERNTGLKRIPVIIFDDDTHLTEPSNADLEAKLAELAAAEESGESAESVESTPTAASDTESFEVVDNADAGRFELQRDGETVGFASYSINGDPTSGEAVVIPHVETFPQHQGQGYASRLMEGLLPMIRSTGRTVTPLCPFAAGHIRSRPEHQDLVTPRG